MGLAIEVGMLADLVDHDVEGAAWTRESFAKVNEVLQKNGLPVHNEPETLPVIRSRAELAGYPYSFLHYLRRFYACSRVDPDWAPTPVADNDDPSLDPAVEEEMFMMSSHLLCHSDSEGFYMPIDFDDIIFDDVESVPGGMLGSSYRLMEELVEIAP